MDDNNRGDTTPCQVTNHRNILSTRNLLIAGIATAVLLSVSGVLFFWNRDVHMLHRGYVLDNGLWGTFGDFVGGVIGTLLAFAGVIATCLIFMEQRKQTDTINRQQSEQNDRIRREQKSQADIQRFNAVFFELTELHRQQIAELREKPVFGLSSTDTSRDDYFERCKKELWTHFEPTKSYAASHRMAQRQYLQFYLGNASNLAPYFRILYRIFDLIDKSLDDEAEKVRYAKIVRAQLTEAELFMLRYNGTTPYGDKFVEYVNKYRLLKHLPILSLLEFKKLESRLVKEDNLYRYALNMIFFTTWKRIYDITKNPDNRTDNIIEIEKTKRYRFGVSMKRPNRTVLMLTVNHREPNRHPVLKCFKRFKPDDFSNLLSDFLKEMYRYSNYRRYNVNLKFYNKTYTRGDTSDIVCWVVNGDGELRLSHPSRLGNRSASAPAGGTS